MGESQSRSVMLHHQDHRLNSAYRGGAGGSSLRAKDTNFNFLPGGADDGAAETSRTGDENRNPVRPRNLPLGRDPQSAAAPGLMSPRTRLPCWSPLEPLPEVEGGDDGGGRVPPDGAEEWRMEEEEGTFDERKRRKEAELPDDEWGDSDSGSEVSLSSLNAGSGGEAGGWDRVGVGEPKAGRPENQSSDSDGELMDGELMEGVWTLRDRERFKAQEMEKHQVQLTMYRRLALIRWVRALQGRVQEQQSRLQSSFDVILTHRKELLRMGAAATAVGQS